MLFEWKDKVHVNNQATSNVALHCSGYVCCIQGHKPCAAPEITVRSFQSIVIRLAFVNMLRNHQTICFHEMEAHSCYIYIYLPVFFLCESGLMIFKGNLFVCIFYHQCKNSNKVRCAARFKDLQNNCRLQKFCNRILLLRAASPWYK